MAPNEGSWDDPEDLNLQGFLSQEASAARPWVPDVRQFFRSRAGRVTTALVSGATLLLVGAALYEPQLRAPSQRPEQAPAQPRRILGRSMLPYFRTDTGGLVPPHGDYNLAEEQAPLTTAAPQISTPEKEVTSLTAAETTTTTLAPTTTTKHLPPPSDSLLVLPQRPAPKGDNALGYSVVVNSESPTLYCYAVVIADTAEQWLMRVQLERRTGIFGCHRFSIYSDGHISLGRGPWGEVEVVEIPGKPAWHAPVAGSGEMVWHNTGVFARAWLQMQYDGAYRNYDWTVKVDPDTAFFPGILQRKLAEKQIDPSIPAYFVNCEKWKSFQGPLEIFTRAAAELFIPGVGTCMSQLSWTDWGEDWFVEHCLNNLGVQQRDGFDLLDDYWCDHQDTVCSKWKPAFHPLKSTDEMKSCLAQVLPEYVMNMAAAAEDYSR